MNKSVRFVGVHGPAGSGKSVAVETIRTELIETTNVKSKIIPFALNLKQTAKSLGWDGKKDEIGREILQALGTEVLRKIDPYWHIWSWIADVITELYKEIETRIIFVDDVRFQNEFDIIKYFGGYQIKIINRRDGSVNREHQSEKELDDDLFDCVIDSSVVLESFCNSVRQLWRDRLRNYILTGEKQDGQVKY